jgi:hypothetical protein
VGGLLQCESADSSAAGLPSAFFKCHKGENIMNIKEVREILTEIGKLDPKEAKTLFEKASNKAVTDEELGETLQSRISKSAVHMITL